VRHNSAWYGKTAMTVLEKLKNIVIVWFKKKIIFAGVIRSGLPLMVMQ
jgi:hypothetical protein